MIGLELVLRVDNVLVIAILAGKLPKKDRRRARLLGLGLAMLLRLAMLLLVLQLSQLEKSVIMHFSVRDLILLGGGLFLLGKAVMEIHHTVELKEDDHPPSVLKRAIHGILMQIVLLELVFSIDSVIIAVGLTSTMGDNKLRGLQLSWRNALC